MECHAHFELAIVSEILPFLQLPTHQVSFFSMKRVEDYVLLEEAVFMFCLEGGKPSSPRSSSVLSSPKTLIFQHGFYFLWHLFSGHFLGELVNHGQKWPQLYWCRMKGESNKERTHTHTLFSKVFLLNGELLFFSPVTDQQDIQIKKMQGFLLLDNKIAVSYLIKA